MFARHALHGLRILVSCAPELQCRYPSSKLPWLHEGRIMQVKLAGIFPLSEFLSALALSEHPRRIHCSAAVVSHHGRDTPWCTTYGNDMVAAFIANTAYNMHPNPVPFTRWLHTAWLCIGETRGSHNCVSRGMADQPSSQSMTARDTRFLESLKVCREYVHSVPIRKLAVPCTIRACRYMRLLEILNRPHNY